MQLTAGEKLGPYEILSLLGAGGMGEVYRARDPRLGREVAVKVAAAQFTERFEREARAVAALNHPNICHLYDVGPNYLVMELVEGKTLAGPLPLETAVDYARQIAEALEAAHEKGIVHRDLKPGNIKVTPEGKVKVLDFGLAKALDEEPRSGSAQDSPTVTLSATRTGMILGTAAYMSPEQAKGKSADRRADIWAFGVVFYEMLTGKALFTGETVGEVLASVIKEQPNLDVLPASARPLIERCLNRDTRRRLQSIGEARILLEDGLRAPIVSAPARSRFGAIGWAVAALAIAAATRLAFVHFRETPPDRSVVRFRIAAPENATFNVGSGLKISPDGRHLAFATLEANGEARVWIQALDSLEAHLVPGSERAVFSSPFWSADSRSVAFVANGKLRKADASGGPSVVLCEVVDSVGSGTWNRDGVILFGGSQGILRTSQAGGAATPVTRVETPKEQTHGFPYFLPDGRHFIYQAYGASTTLYVTSLDGKERKALGTGGNPQYAPPATPGGTGHLLFVQDHILRAQPLDPKTFDTVGEAFPVNEEVGSTRNGTVGFYSVSANGTLASYRLSATRAFGTLTWFDRAGKSLETLGPTGIYYGLRLSRTGTRVAVTQDDFSDIWILDTTGGGPSRLTLNPAVDRFPVWSPDGRRMAFSSNRGSRLNAFNVYWKGSDGIGDEEPLLPPGTPQIATDWSSDGELLLLQAQDSKTGQDLWVLPMGQDSAKGKERKPIPYLHESFDETQGQFSPAAVGAQRWVAYTSNETGRDEVYVISYPPGTGKFPISNGGGSWPRWSRDGKELFYISSSGNLMAVEVKTAPKFERGATSRLFALRIPHFPITGISIPECPYDVAPDGKRFLVINQAPVPYGTVSQITVALNWTAGLKK